MATTEHRPRHGPRPPGLGACLCALLVTAAPLTLAATPDETLLALLQTTYEAAANLAGWDRKSLEQSR